MAATVGALRIDLGMNSAEFTSGLKQAEAGMQQFAKSSKQVGAAADDMARRMNGASQRSANLMFQLQDIGVSLASGQNPLMVAIQQGSQISMIYGPEQGGLGGALRETAKLAAGLVTKFWPVAAATGAVAAGFAAITHEMNKTGETQVTVGQVMQATWDEVASQLYTVFKPAIEGMSAWMSDAWDRIARQTFLAVNAMIRSVVSFAEQAMFAVKGLPDAFIVAGQSAANGFISAIEWLVQQSLGGIQRLIDGINSFIDQFGGDALRNALGWDLSVPDLVNPNEPFTLDRVDIGGEAAAERLAAGYGDLQARLAEIASTDYLGGIADKAQKLALASKEAATGVGNIGGAAKAANDNLKGMADEGLAAAQQAAENMRDTFKDVFRGFISDIQSGKSALEALANAVSDIGNRLLDAGLDALFGALFPTPTAKPNLTDLIFGKRAAGGPVTAGRPYLIGERGPELFMPHRSGTVIPNDAIRSGGGTNVTVQIDARNADAAAVAQLRRMQAELPATIVQTVKEAQKRRQL